MVLVLEKARPAEYEYENTGIPVKTTRNVGNDELIALSVSHGGLAVLCLLLA